MTVPQRREAARLLLSLEPPEWFLRHACAVADVAAWLAMRVEAHAGGVDRAAVEAAALLHDVDKLRAAANGRLPHGEGSAEWLSRHSLAELAPLVRDHPVTRLADDAQAARLAAAPIEARIVAYADKRAGQQLESMEQRFASWRRRYPTGPAPRQDAPADARAGAPTPGTDPDGPPTGEGWGEAAATRVAARAADLERDVCALAGVAPADVGRLRWSRRALREAAEGSR